MLVLLYLGKTKNSGHEETQKVERGCEGKKRINDNWNQKKKKKKRRQGNNIENNKLIKSLYFSFRISHLLSLSLEITPYSHLVVRVDARQNSIRVKTGRPDKSLRRLCHLLGRVALQSLGIECLNDITKDFIGIGEDGRVLPNITVSIIYNSIQ